MKLGFTIGFCFLIFLSCKDRKTFRGNAEGAHDRSPFTEPQPPPPLIEAPYPDVPVPIVPPSVPPMPVIPNAPTFASGYCAQLAVETLPRSNMRRDAPSGTILEDIVQHLPNSYRGSSLGYGNTYFDSDQGTWAHETTHGIHAHLRNHFNKTGGKVNALYLTEDKYIILREPRIRKSQIGAFVPGSLRTSKYSLYVTGNSAWDQEPLYVWDEWGAYINGAMARVDLYRKNALRNSGSGREDTINAAAESSVFAIATVMAIAQFDNDYFNREPSLRAALGCNLERAFRIYNDGVSIPKYNWNDGLITRIRTSPDAESLRKFTRDFLGAPWAKNVLGI